MSIKRNSVSYFVKPVTENDSLVARVNRKGELFMVFFFGGEQKHSPVDSVGGWEVDLLGRGWELTTKTKFYDLRSKLIK